MDPDQHVKQSMVTAGHPGQVHHQVLGIGIEYRLQLPAQLRQPVSSSRPITDSKPTCSVRIVACAEPVSAVRASVTEG